MSIPSFSGSLFSLAIQYITTNLNDNTLISRVIANEERLDSISSLSDI